MEMMKAAVEPVHFVATVAKREKMLSREDPMTTSDRRARSRGVPTSPWRSAAGQPADSDNRDGRSSVRSACSPPGLSVRRRLPSIASEQAYRFSPPAEPAHVSDREV